MQSDKNLKLINFYAFFAYGWYFVPILLPFCQDRLHVGYREMLYGESAFAASCILFDVPTGWISDVWKRKHVMALGSGINALGTFLLIFASSIWHLIISQILIGIGISLINGTHTAMLYDTLATLKDRTHEYRRREGMRQATSLYGTAFAGTVGGLVYPLHNLLPIYLAVGTHLMAFACSWLMEEPEKHKVHEQRHPVADIVKTFKFVLHGHGEVGLVVLMAATIFSATKVIMWAQQPYYRALHIPESYYGMLMAMGWLLGGISSHNAHRMDGKVNNFHALIAAALAAILFSLGAGLHLAYTGVALLIVGGSCIFGTTSPRVNEIINRNVEAGNRATLLSTQTFLVSILFIPLSNLFGWIADKWSIQTALIFVSCWLTIIGACLLTWKRKSKIA